LCNFCPNTCSQQAILMKVSHLGVDTLVYRSYHGEIFLGTGEYETHEKTQILKLTQGIFRGTLGLERGLG
jgi:hypothetical protein